MSTGLDLSTPHDRPNLTRRGFLKTLSLAVGAAVLAPWGQVAAVGETRSLRLQLQRSDESLSLVYYKDGEYISDSLRKISHLFRDIRTGQTKPIDPELLDLLYRVSCSVCDNDPVYEVLSAYRSPKTNAMLRRRSRRVAKNSLHLQGKAVDVRLANVELRQLRDVAVDLRAGGVGYYPRTGFVHLDVGDVRSW